MRTCSTFPVRGKVLHCMQHCPDPLSLDSAGPLQGCQYKHSMVMHWHQNPELCLQ